jgi:hypothetical protein
MNSRYQVFFDPLSLGFDSGATFLPIPELSTPNADGFIVFLSANDIRYQNAVQDPWFKATTPAPAYHLHQENSTLQQLFFRDDPVTVLGCTEKFQFCKFNGQCTSLAGSDPATDQARTFWSNEDEQARFMWSAEVIEGSAMPLNQVVGVLATNSLLAAKLANNGIQTPLLDNQWELEVENWVKISLADLQRAFVEEATGPTDPRIGVLLQRPLNPLEEDACGSQKVKSDTFMSFSVLGLAITFSFSALITISSLILPPMMERITETGNAYKSVEWNTNDIFHLQRQAYERLGNDSPPIDQDKSFRQREVFQLQQGVDHTSNLI